MLLDQMVGETVRVSVSSHTSSQGSGQDDYDALGYVFMWGKGIGDGFLGGGICKIDSGKGKNLDALYPKAVGSSVVLDAQQIACGGKHAALVTRQGEVFSWGEESGGWLGHGVTMDIPYPKLVEALTSYTVDFVACGEYHTCALTQSGDLYSWGDGAHNFSLLGHGRDISHWTPKRISGGIEGLRVSSVSCGPWHTALVTASGQLFTFGDGTFGVLGHGNRTSISTPKEIESLKGLKTVKAACGVWHTAAVVEVMVGYSSSNNFSSGKLFTWGDGDKGRLGHEDKEKRLVPTCVSALIDYNFQQVACGHSLTVALTTSGHVFTLGSAVYGQLGEPHADGKSPVCVEGQLWDAVIEEIACGAHHVAVLTSKSEVYTWGKGANGRLGHGDIEDKKSPALVTALKDRQVKSIACGLSFTAAICLHKWGGGSEQPSCASCRQPFNFTRKRHKCYNCGIVVCHGCSSKKSYNALMAPNPHKPYRVCDSCYLKISQMASQMHPVNKMAKKQRQVTSLHRPQTNMKMLVSQTQPRARRRADSSSKRVVPAPLGLLKWGPTGVMLPSETADLILQASVLHSRRKSPRRGSRSVSPFSRRASPLRSTTPTPTLRGLTSPQMIVEDLKRTNGALSQEVRNLQIQIKHMTRQHHLREAKLQEKLNDALASVAEESERCRAAKEVIKSLTGQLKAFAERSPDMTQTSTLLQGDIRLPEISVLTAGVGTLTMPERENEHDVYDAGKVTDRQNQAVADQSVEHTVMSNTASIGTRRGLKQEEDGPEGSASGKISEWVEHDESGVYITLVSHPNGRRDLKRVRFSKRRFTEKQAELWWAENRARIFEKYNVKSMDMTLYEPKTGRT